MSRFVLFSDSTSQGWCAEPPQCLTLKTKASNWRNRAKKEFAEAQQRTKPLR
ncbi:hypothetical protein [Leptolyngbya sp. FACHB-321]|uniref:hypothetical protein n=1 Tax=Leptolyngbya sp. FACHB-321 TaxID=2692807 RepID=UPI001683009E|nr:hypothetical protein [Leptolyngbya sp. FACHB-321]